MRFSFIHFADAARKKQLDLQYWCPLPPKVPVTDEAPNRTGKTINPADGDDSVNLRSGKYALDYQIVDEDTNSATHDDIEGHEPALVPPGK